MRSRMQFSVDAVLRQRARERAAALGLTLSEYICRLIAVDLGIRPGLLDVSAIFDLAASGEVTDIARDKDKMIGEAVWAEYLRKTRK